MTRIDRYLLRAALWPMAGAIAVTLLALLLERTLRLLDLLSASSDRFGFVVELVGDLVPHYLGLTLPAAFFVAMFIVVVRLNDGSEIDVMMAGGVSLSRIAAPFLALGAVLAVVSLVLFGFVQPASRYAYRAVLHAAQNAGWSGRLQGQAFISPGERFVMTADGADGAGRNLRRVFVRERMADGGERVTTSATAHLEPGRDLGHVAVLLTDGRQVRFPPKGAAETIAFERLSLDAPLSGAARLLRGRGGDARELTLFELAARAGEPRPGIPRRELLAELYGRLARALSLPLLPLLALPLALAAKRQGRAPGVIVAGLLLFAFQNLLQFGQAQAAHGRLPAGIGVGVPFAAFAGLAAWIFLGSRVRPGETPLARLTERLDEALRAVRARLPAPPERTPA